MNDLLLYSPNQMGFKPDRTHSSSAKTPKTMNHRSLEAAPNKGISSNPRSRDSSPSVGAKSHEIPSVPIICVQSPNSSAPGGNSGDHAGNDTGFETFNM